MCGRFVNNEKIPVQARRFAASASAESEAWTPTYNATPGRRHPVVLREDDRRIDLLHWGWKLDFGFFANARGEEAFEKKSFATAMRERRCLIPANAFYEWTERIRKQTGITHAFRLATSELFGIGGLWRIEEIAGKQTRSVILLTTAANAVVAPTHHRMALMIPASREAEWLDTVTPISVVRELVVPFPTDLMVGFRVGPEIDKLGADGPQLLHPATGPTQQTLFP